MASRTTPAKTAILLCTALSGCESGVETLDEPAQDFRALTTEKGVSFDVVTWPREAMGPAARSEGYLMVRLQNGPASTGPASPPQPDDILGTCGVTFVSPTIAVTAGHCLPGLAENDLVEVRVARALPGYDPDGEILGTFPTYQHEGPLDDDGDGSLAEVYDCSLRLRPVSMRREVALLFDDEPEINCDITHPGVPAPRQHHARHRHHRVSSRLVAERIATTTSDVADDARRVDDLVAMPWYHEVYDPGSARPRIRLRLRRPLPRRSLNRTTLTAMGERIPVTIRRATTTVAEASATRSCR